MPTASPASPATAQTGANTAKVISAGKGEVPNSGRDALSIITDRPYLVGGEEGTMTGIMSIRHAPDCGKRPERIAPKWTF